MARDYSPFQRKVIQRYYRNMDAIRSQKLSELVTEIYLATTPKRTDSLWARAAKLLDDAPKKGASSPTEDASSKEGAEDRAAIAAILEARDVEALAELAGQRFG